MPFEPHEVSIIPGRKFEDFYTRGEEIGRYDGLLCWQTLNYFIRFIALPLLSRDHYRGPIIIRSLIDNGTNHYGAMVVLFQAVQDLFSS